MKTSLTRVVGVFTKSLCISLTYPKHLLHIKLEFASELLGKRANREKKH
jgi:hypothetical protein